MLVAAVAIFGTMSCSAQRIFSNIPSGDGITKVYVSKAMMKMAGPLSGDNMNFGIPKSAVKSIDGIEVISVDNKKAASQVAQMCKKALEGFNLLPITEVESDGQNVNIYITPDSANPSISKNLIILVDSRKDYQAVAFHGTFNVDSLAGMMPTSK